MQENAALANVTNYTALYSSGHTVICQENTNDISCTADFSGVDSRVQATCQNDSGQLYTTNEEFSCDYQSQDGNKRIVSLSFLDLGICVGSNCSQSYLDSVIKKGAANVDSIFQQPTNNVTENLAAKGLTNCVLSFSSGTKVFITVTIAVCATLSFVGEFIVSMMA